MGIQNRTLFAALDNLHVMRGMDSESVDLIATDPPFNTKRVFNAPLGSKAAGQRFSDCWVWPDIRIDRLPRAEVVVRVGIAESTAYVLRVILQNGKDINGLDIREDCTLDHIDPACEGNELTFGNMHPMIKRLNSRKKDRPLADYLDGEVKAGRMTSRRRDDLVELDEARKKDPTGFMDWWLRQHQNAYDNANGGDGKSNG